MRVLSENKNDYLFMYFLILSLVWIIVRCELQVQM
jgi:hypothetical protein